MNLTLPIIQNIFRIGQLIDVKFGHLFSKAQCNRAQSSSAPVSVAPRKD